VVEEQLKMTFAGLWTQRAKTEHKTLQPPPGFSVVELVFASIREDISEGARSEGLIVCTMILLGSMGSLFVLQG